MAEWCGSHFYICWTEYDGNYRKSLVHIPDRPHCIGHEVLYVIAEFLVKSNLVEFIITLLPERLSIVIEGSILFPPSIIAKSVATKQTREADEIDAPQLVGALNDRKGRWLATTI